MALILVIDDDVLVRLTVRSFLEAAGHDVVEASDGDQAHSMFKESPADLVLCDLVMSGKGGISTIRELKRGYSHVPVIAISGGAQRGDRDLLPIAKDFGADHTLQKPFGGNELLTLVASCLRSN